MLKVLIIIGTRPELIKMAILYKLLTQTKGFKAILCLTGQHSTLINDSLSCLDIEPDLILPRLGAKDSLTQKMSGLLSELQKQVDLIGPDLIMVQGDTLSALCGATVAFMNRIKLAHIEAGLRTYDKGDPFPEESIRRQISSMADIHFAPTELAAQNLMREGIPGESIHVTGNTGIDALLDLSENSRLSKSGNTELLNFIERVRQEDKRLLLLTLHRRENQSGRIQEIINELVPLVQKNRLALVCIEHPNPKARMEYSEDHGTSDVFKSSSLPYDSFIALMKKSDLILTDSGGIQEEAPSLGKPVLILRKGTERVESLDGQHWTLYDQEDLERGIMNSLRSDTPVNRIFGDGKASQRIVHYLQQI